jgi:hypothetical protein
MGVRVIGSPLYYDRVRFSKSVWAADVQPTL